MLSCSFCWLNVDIAGLTVAVIITFQTLWLSVGIKHIWTGMKVSLYQKFSGLRHCLDKWQWKYLICFKSHLKSSSWIGVTHIVFVIFGKLNGLCSSLLCEVWVQWKKADTPLPAGNKICREAPHWILAPWWKVPKSLSYLIVHWVFTVGW